MKISVHSPVNRGAAPGTRRCEGCRCAGLPLHECRIPYSNAGAYWRDLDQPCIDRLRSAPELPPLAGGHDRARVDGAFDQLLHALAEPPPAAATPGAGEVSGSRETWEPSRP